MEGLPKTTNAGTSARYRETFCVDLCQRYFLSYLNGVGSPYKYLWQHTNVNASVPIMDFMPIEQFQQTHLAIWNEKDRQKRDQQIAVLYSEEIRMYDKDFILQGRKAVSDFIDKVQTDTKFNFEPTHPMELTQNGARLFWNIQTTQGVLNGMDFFIIEEGKVAHLYVFMKMTQ